MATHPGEWRVLQDMLGWQAATGVPVEIREDTRFLCPLPRFRAWAAGRRQYRMEFFYREMRRETGLLMEGDDPVGGKWNFDAENRAALPKGLVPPAPRRFVPDEITRAVMTLVAGRFGGHFGDVDGFAWPVTAREARAALDDFIAHRLPRFGLSGCHGGRPDHVPRPDRDQPEHRPVDPMEARRAAEDAWREIGLLNAVEGFIRQILGWREYGWALLAPDAGLRGGERLAPRARRPAYWGAPMRLSNRPSADRDSPTFTTSSA